MQTIKQAFQFAEKELLINNTKNEAHAIVRLLFESVLKIPHNHILTQSDKAFTQSEELHEYLIQLQNNKPIHQIIGHIDFFKLKILVNEDVLIPRPETEELLEWIFEETSAKPRVIFDVCTGSGCIALALRAHFSNSEIIACDISTKALKTAKNSEKLNFETSIIKWVELDILQESERFDQIDIFVSNPPYIKTSEAEEMSQSVLKYEPKIALFAPKEDPLLFYKKILDLSGKNTSAVFYFELNPETAIELKNYCLKKDWNCLLKEDMSNKIRFAKIWK